MTRITLQVLHRSLPEVTATEIRINHLQHNLQRIHRKIRATGEFFSFIDYMNCGVLFNFFF